MKLEVAILANGIRHAKLTGRMDFQGNDKAFEELFPKLARSPEPVLIDLSQVDFITSVGLRTLMSAAKAVRQFGARAVILKPTPRIREVLVTAGIDAMIPIHDDFESGCRALGKERASPG